MTAIPNVYQRSAGLLAAQFQDTLPNGGMTNFQKLIYSLCTEAQTIENELQILLLQRALLTAVGAQLDGIGQIVGLARIPGQPDDSTNAQTGYREDLQFQIFYNNSQATPEEMIFIAAYITNSTNVLYNEFYPAAYEFTVNGRITNGFFGNFKANTVPILLKGAGPAGVQYPPVITTNGVPIIFSFSNDVDFEPLYASKDAVLPPFLVPFYVNPGSGPEQLYVQRGEKTNPLIGGGFSEYYSSTMFNDTIGAGQLAEVVQVNGNLPP